MSARDDVAAGRRRLHIKAVCQSMREATTASGVDNAASPTGRHTAEQDYFTLRERADHYYKNNWKEPKYINEQCRWSCPYRWATRPQCCRQYTRASGGV